MLEGLISSSTPPLVAISTPVALLGVCGWPRGCSDHIQAGDGDARGGPAASRRTVSLTDGIPSRAIILEHFQEDRGEGGGS